MCLIHIIQGTRGCGGEYKINSSRMTMMMIMIFCIHPREGPIRFPRRERRGCDELVREVEDLRMVLGIKRGREGGRAERESGWWGGRGRRGRPLLGGDELVDVVEALEEGGVVLSLDLVGLIGVLDLLAKGVEDGGEGGEDVGVVPRALHLLLHRAQLLDLALHICTPRLESYD